MGFRKSPEKWQVYAGMGGRFTPEWVAGLDRNARQFYSGMGGRFTPDFAIELPTTLIQDYPGQPLSPNRGYIVDGILFFGNHSQTEQYSLNLETGEKIQYDLHKDYHKLYGQLDNDLLIVGRIEMTDIGYIRRPYLYDPEKGTYTHFSDFEGLRYETYSVTHLYDSVYLVVMYEDPAMFQNYIYDISNSKYEKLPGIDRSKQVAAVSPDKLTAVLCELEGGFIQIYNLVDKKVIQDEETGKTGRGIMYLSNNLFITDYNSYNIYHLNPYK